MSIEVAIEQSDMKKSTAWRTVFIFFVLKEKVSIGTKTWGRPEPFYKKGEAQSILNLAANAVKLENEEIE